MEFDYKELGLKVGIEIHQQIDTNKLFCSCKSGIIDGEPDVKVVRRLRATAGEEGEVDVAATHEMKKEKEFIYYFYRNANCLVELDEEPPHEINREALHVALQISKILHAKATDCVQVMRKTVVDGSNTSGFQRTALIARNGYFYIDENRIHVQTLCLEEEAAKIVERTAERDIYNLSRLGIPLVEIGTGPDMHSPEEVTKAAEYLGMVLRSCKVKRGLGTIRQDVNVSIKGGSRVEIKGAQNLRMLGETVKFEVMRQQSLLAIKDMLWRRKIKAIDTKKIDITGLMEKSESHIIKEALAGQGLVAAIKLEGFSGLIGKEIQPNRRLGTEMADYARQYVKGIFHSDELPKYGITQEEVDSIKSELQVGEKDAFVLVAADAARVQKALDAVIERSALAIHGVPKEVRKANIDGTTSFLRPMPGASRMYPETDLRTIKPDTEGILVPELLTDKARRFAGMGISKDVAVMISKSRKLQWFEEFVHAYGEVEPAFIALTILNSPKELKSRFNLEAEFTREFYHEVFAHLNDGDISKEAVLEIMAEFAKTKSVDLSRFKKMSDEELEDSIRAVIEKNKSLPFNALIGKVMNSLRGKADGKKIAEVTKKLSSQQ